MKNIYISAIFAAEILSIEDQYIKEECYYIIGPDIINMYTLHEFIQRNKEKYSNINPRILDRLVLYRQLDSDIYALGSRIKEKETMYNIDQLYLF